MTASTAAPPVAEIFRAPPDLRLDEHGHDSTHLCLPLTGAFYESDGAEERWMDHGSVRISPPGDRHRIRFGPTATDCLLVFLPDAYLSRRGAREIADRSFSRTERIHRLADRLRRATKDDRAACALTVEEVVLELCAVADRGPRARSTPPNWLRRVRERLEDAPESPPTLQELATVADRNRAQVARAFRRHFGSSIGRFVRRRRLLRAVPALLGTDRPLAEIAHAYGFSDQSHLTRQVTAFLGRPPAALRRLRQSDRDFIHSARAST